MLNEKMIVMITKRERERGRETKVLKVMLRRQQGCIHGNNDNVSMVITMSPWRQQRVSSGTYLCTRLLTNTECSETNAVYPVQMKKKNGKKGCSVNNVFG